MTDLLEIIEEHLKENGYGFQRRAARRTIGGTIFILDDNPDYNLIIGHAEIEGTILNVLGIRSYYYTMGETIDFHNPSAFEILDKTLKTLHAMRLRTR